MSRLPEVSLVDVDEEVMDQLLDLAKRDASPDEVAPPLGGPGWNLERTAWFFSYHRAASEGLEGAAGEKSWGILADGALAGSIRLKRVGSGGGRESAETGIWLGRSFRSRGIGSAALGLVLHEARRAGLRRVTARTLAGNVGAQRILAGAGAILTRDDDGTVRAVVVL
ncbi:GNAT family N-acetyltransferase [Pseudarthrobacter phenanthrenivorans]|uniref:GNAT family N-acetyltransferase n=1 Tax=Pseudarthrobacter phenanthrenivorans TaxID=361575 RepID=A0A3B0G623_PSEPS|nr:GNAT family N-acetyltransferase [Pseudarthrobacter phenanthrenivorans]RKO27488.1 GNAT family N-acetyltransferase [Pseudarthrobacter phenanthrenivorans]TPV53429.1 GNAT family N-acetyltransferase [Pseudarthrobacter phenanthrenivorans]